MTVLGPVSLHLAEGKDGEKSAGSIGDLLDQVSKTSVGEVDGLIGELRRLRGKLEADAASVTRITAHPTLYCFPVIAPTVPGGAPPKLRLEGH